MRRLLIDEDWWSKIDFLLKFTLPTFELLREADIERPFLGEVYDGMDSLWSASEGVWSIVPEEVWSLDQCQGQRC